MGSGRARRGRPSCGQLSQASMVLTGRPSLGPGYIIAALPRAPLLCLRPFLNT